MNELLSKIKPADILAAIVIISCVVLKLNGLDGTTTALMASVCFYYFGKRGAQENKTNAETRTPSIGDGGA